MQYLMFSATTEMRNDLQSKILSGKFFQDERTFEFLKRKSNFSAVNYSCGFGSADQKWRLIELEDDVESSEVTSLVTVSNSVYCTSFNIAVNCPFFFGFQQKQVVWLFRRKTAAMLVSFPNLCLVYSRKLVR